MKVIFEHAANSYQEAETFLRVIRGADPTPAATSLIRDLERQTLACFADDTDVQSRLAAAIASHEGTESAGAGSFWQRLFGPSRREQELSKQRSAALERAERAELSSFEAVAEMAEVEKQRDEALREVENLRHQMGAND